MEQKGDEDDVIVDEELLVGRLSAARVKNCLSLAESLRTVCVQKLGGEVLTMMLYCIGDVKKGFGIIWNLTVEIT